MASWFQALKKSRDGLTTSLSGLFRRKDADHEQTLEDLEEALLGADLAPRLVMELIEELEDHPRATPIEKRERIRQRLVSTLPARPTLSLEKIDGRPQVVLLVGVNGSGKTTTTAKLARMWVREGRKALVAAGDTFRAAGTDQLRLWAERVGCDVVAGKTGSDAASVAFDAVTAACARGVDAVFVDTAGRMHTRKPLMDELAKIVRSVGKAAEGAPDEVWMVLDASLGQNAVHQARFFSEVVPLTGVVITKLDGSSRAGFLFSIVGELNVPVCFAGLGEGEDDLERFDPVAFVDALLDFPLEAEAGV